MIDLIHNLMAKWLKETNNYNYCIVVVKSKLHEHNRACTASTETVSLSDKYIHKQGVHVQTVKTVLVCRFLASSMTCFRLLLIGCFLV